MSDHHQEFPRWLHHPGEQPAILSNDYANGERPALGHAAPAGRPRMFPPVMVNNPDQEEYYVSKGYTPGQSTKAAYVAAQEAARMPAGYRQQDYPMMVDGRLVQDPGALPPADDQYPKWVEGPKGRELARDAAHELTIIASSAIDQGDEVPSGGYSVTDAGFLAAMDAAAGPPEISRLERPNAMADGRAKRWALIREAQALGIPADVKWKTPALKRAIGEKKNENQTESADSEEVTAASADGAVVW